MIQRQDLPQIPKEQYKEFIKYLQTNGVRIEVVLAPTKMLHPIQGHINRKKVDDFKTKPATLKLPVFCSQGGLILDGHHRWVARMENGEELTPAIIAKCPIKKLIELGHDFEGSFTKTVYETTTYYKRSIENNDTEKVLMVKKPLNWK